MPYDLAVFLLKFDILILGLLIASYSYLSIKMMYKWLCMSVDDTEGGALRNAWLNKKELKKVITVFQVIAFICTFTYFLIEKQLLDFDYFEIGHIIMVFHSIYNLTIPLIILPLTHIVTKDKPIRV